MDNVNKNGRLLLKISIFSHPCINWLSFNECNWW